ncbi:FecCD family ABC transporter permease [Pararobbsia silviterrae]|uniref:Iron ABC transporter permease n=1 Tax=Pararobbsia silviterrae TaxID=1792498 RepID=A0A494YA71_9BURK|nr:iron ABC transporter permease [Pararobbsia silviterrae]RKP56800.1 iron ABC transporter permease [Pararobbsia silviterrae]
MTARRASLIWLALAAVACVVLAASVCIGSVVIAPAVLAHLAWDPIARGFGALFAHVFDASASVAHDGARDPLARAIVLQLRLPRALAGFACGALLSLAGALLQVLLRNPLADPYVLGVSGGSAVFALPAMWLMLPWWGVDAAAFAGAIVSIALVLVLTRGDLWRAEPRDVSPRLLLTGAVLAAAWGALITLMLSLAPDARLRGMVFWLSGDLDGVERAWPAWLALALALAVTAPLAPRLNALMRGEALAQSVGIAVPPLRRRIYLIASLATAVAVTTAGTIGFVGLIVPHLLRLAFGNDQRMLLPAAALGGGALVAAADLAARTIVAPAQLPVGVVTALVGAPVFLYILLGRRR